MGTKTPGDDANLSHPVTDTPAPLTGKVTSLTINADGTVRGNPELIIPEGVDRDEHVAGLEKHTATQLESVGVKDAEGQAKKLVAAHLPSEK